MIENYKQAVTLRTKTPDEIEMEMENPNAANFAIYEYNFPNGIKCGVGKSRRPGHASMFQIIVTDFDGKPNVKFPEEYAGEYTSPTRTEKDLAQYCKESWQAAEAAKTKATRKKPKEEDGKVFNEKGEEMLDTNYVVSDAEALASAAG